MGLLLFGGVSHHVLPEIDAKNLYIFIVLMLFFSINSYTRNNEYRYGLIATALLRLPIVAPILRVLGACEADRRTVEVCSQKNPFFLKC
jgi:hypothetical protein